MGIEKVNMYAPKCDRCGCYYEDGENQFLFNNPFSAANTISDDGWCINGENKCYCRNCHTIEEDTNEVIIKPML